jgi:hypothetical protein
MCVFKKPPLTSFFLLTSLDILEKPIAHKGTDKPLSWIQNPVVRPTHEIPRLVKHDSQLVKNYKINKLSLTEAYWSAVKKVAESSLNSLTRTL